MNQLEQYQLTPLEADLLQQHIIQIFGQITEDTADYVAICITMCLAQGNENKYPDLSVHINSEGGGLFPAMTIYDLLRLYPGHVTGIVIGEACSSANMILQSCDLRFASRHSMLLVHTSSSYSSLKTKRDKTKWQELRDFEEELMDQIYDIYRLRSRLPKREIKRLFDDEKLMTARRAKELGIIDKII